MAQQLNPRILSKLGKQLPKEETTIRKDISLLRRDYPALTHNAVAQIYARKHGKTVLQLLDAEDKASLSTVPQPVANQVAIPTKGIQKPRAKNPPGSDSDPFITTTHRNGARSNAEIYPTLYLFENSVRGFVSAAMEKDYGKDWWKQKIEPEKPKLAEKITIRMSAEQEYPWHSKRGAHPINYTDIDDLLNIINTYGTRNVFKKALGKQKERVVVWIQDIEKTRHIISHNNPVSQKDKTRVTQYAHDWHLFATEAEKKLS